MRVLILGFVLWVVSGYASFTLTWGKPAISLSVNPPLGDTHLNPRVAIDAMGNAVAVWSQTQSNGAREDVWAAQYNHATRVWTGAVKISGGANATRPSIAMNEEGWVVVVWEEGFPSQIRTRTFSGGLWTPPLGVSPAFACKSPCSQIAPQVVLDGAGHAIAVWEEIAASRHRIHSSVKFLNSDWKNLGILSSKDANAVLSAINSLALNSRGEGIAVWEENRKEVWGARFLEGEWMRPFPISLGCGEAHDPSAAIDAAGNAVIVWSWAHAIVLSKTLIEGNLSPLPLTVSNPAWIAKHPQVQVDASGNALAVFERYDVGPGESPKHQFLASAHLPFEGDAWSSPVDISGPGLSPDASSRAGYPTLVANAAGDAVAIWKEFNGTTFTVQAAGYSMGTWSIFQTLSCPKNHSGSSLPSQDLALALNAAGNILALWPEDSTGAGAQQIKAALGVGLAAAAPQPPTSLPTVQPTQAIPFEPLYISSEMSALSAAQAKGAVSEEEIAPDPVSATAALEHSGEIALPSASHPAPVKFSTPKEWIPELVHKPKSHAHPLIPTLSPPTSGVLYGAQVIRRFPGHADHVNILQWAPSPSAVTYNVYRNDFAFLIGTTSGPYFEDHQRWPGQREFYFVTAVDGEGHESSPITIVVHPSNKRY